MNDALPAELQLQQSSARAVSGEELEVLGKYASTLWHAGRVRTLGEAVVETVKRAALSPEQVRRVVEFANQAAYLEQFRKQAHHKFVHFECGPADPGEVLRDLNDGGGGSRFDSGGGSARPLAPHRKVAGRHLFIDEEDFWSDLASPSDPKIAYVDPYRPLKDVHDELVGLRGHVQSELATLEREYSDATDALFQAVKQAALTGVSLGDVVAAWSATTAEPVHVKVAFRMLVPRLRAEGVFSSFDAVGESLSKVASAYKEVNPEHPLVERFAAYADVLTKLSNLRKLEAEVAQGVRQSSSLLKEAVGGAAGKAWQMLGRASDVAGDVAGRAAQYAVGADPKPVSGWVSRGVRIGTLGAGALGLNAAQQELTDRPVPRKALGAFKSIVPGTIEYDARRYRIANS